MIGNVVWPFRGYPYGYVTFVTFPRADPSVRPSARHAPGPDGGGHRVMRDCVVPDELARR